MSAARMIAVALTLPLSNFRCEIFNRFLLQCTLEVLGYSDRILPSLQAQLLKAARKEGILQTIYIPEH